MCHLKTEDSGFDESASCSESAVGTSGGSKSNASDSGRAGSGSGELAGDRGSNPNAEHSGSGSSGVSVGRASDWFEMGNTASSREGEVEKGGGEMV